MPKTATTSAKPSAAAILLREHEHQLQLLMVQKNPKLNYGNSWVFPGGVSEASDAQTDSMLVNAANTARRETREETGIDLNGVNLMPYSHWLTPAELSKRYSAWFFLCDARQLSHQVYVDQQEIVDSIWISADDALKAHADGKFQLNGPAYISLTELSAYHDVDQLLRQHQACKPKSWQPRGVKHELGYVVLYEEDAAYELEELSYERIEQVQFEQRHRLYMHNNSEWHYVRPAKD